MFSASRFSVTPCLFQRGFEMFPVIVVFGRSISGYSLMGILGFLTSVLYLIIACRIYRYSFDNAIYISVFSIIGGLIGAKLLYFATIIPDLVQRWPIVLKHPVKEILPYLYGGMVFYGGLFGAIGAAHAACRYFNQDLKQLYRILVPVIPLFAGFGRLGCLMAGCCYGKHTSSAFHIIFKHSPFAPNNIPLIPTQLYEAIFDFCLFAILSLIGLRSKTKYSSNLLKIYLCLYALFRFTIEFFRGDDVRGIFLLSTSQWISAAILAVLFTSLLRKAVARHDDA